MKDQHDWAMAPHHQRGMTSRGAPLPSMEHAGAEMTKDDRMEMLKQHHHQTLWVYWSILFGDHDEP